MQARRMVCGIAVTTILMLMTRSWLFATEQSSSAPLPPLQPGFTDAQVRARVRERVGFDEWAGKVRIPGKKVEESPFTAESFRQWSELVWEPDEGSRFEWKTGHSPEFMIRPEVRIEIDVLTSPRVASDVLINVFRYPSGCTPGKRQTEGKLFVGDVAFPMNLLGKTDFTAGLVFTRNNVAVTIYAPERELLEELAAFVDEKLVEALAPTDDPAFSNRPEEPPAEGYEERSLAARRSAADAQQEQWWAKARERVDFDQWAGKVKIAGKRIVRCPFDAASLRKWSESVKERHLAGDWYFGWGADAEKHSILIYVCGSPRDAADSLMYQLFTASWTRPGERITEGELAVGDVAFPMINLDPSVQNNRLAFVRNNVAVVVTAPSRELLEELVTFVDGKLVEALEAN